MTWQPGAMPSCAPRLVHRPSGAVGSLGPEVVELAREAGLELDDWQAWYLDGGLAFRSDGKWAAFEDGLDVPRQNGKGGIIEARMLGGLFLFEERLLTYTAHEFKTSQEHFGRIGALIENTPRLRRKVKRIRKASGAEAVELLSGARLRFLARSAGSGRGFSGDVVFLDEAMILWPAAMGALIPTMSARGTVTAGGPQLWDTGTASLGEPSQVFAAVRARAIAGTDPDLFYAGWEAGDPDDHTGARVDLDDEREWVRSNPAPRITVEFTRKERAALDDETFARERLCIWGGGAARPVIDIDAWAAKALTKLPIAVKTAFAADVPPEGGAACLARAIETKDGRIVVEVDCRPGTLWAEERAADLLNRRRGPFVLDSGSRAGSLLGGIRRRLKRTKNDLTPISTRELAQACGAFKDKLDAGLIYHVGQPELSIAVGGARKRDIGDGGWAWHRRDAGVDISPLVAATLAVHGLTKARERTGRALAV